jgi:hypothetical protein
MMRRCHWCAEAAPAPVADLIAVRWIESGSGPGLVLYACEPHMVEHGLSPLPEPGAASRADVLGATVPCVALLLVLIIVAAR